METSGCFRRPMGGTTLSDLFGPLTTPTSPVDFKDKVKITIKSNAGVKCLKVSKPCDPISPSGSGQEVKSCDFFKIPLPSSSTGLEGATANPKPYLKMSPPALRERATANPKPYGKMSPPGLHEGATANPKPYLKMSPPGLHEGGDSNETEETKHTDMKREEGSSSTTMHDASIHIKQEPGICDTAGGACIIETRNGEDSLPRTRGSSAEVDEMQNCTRVEFLPGRIKEEPLTDEVEPSGGTALADLFGPLTTLKSSMDFKDKVKITVKSNAGVKCLKVSKPCDPVSPSGGGRDLKSCDFFKIPPPSSTTGLERATGNPKPYLKMSPPGLHEEQDSNETEETKHIDMKREGGSSSTAMHDASVHIKQEPGTCDTAGGARAIENRNGEESLIRTHGSATEVDEMQNCTRVEFLPGRIKEEPLTDEVEPSGGTALADLFGPLTTLTSALDFKDKVKITIKRNAGVKCLKVFKPCDPVSPSGGGRDLKSCDFFKIPPPNVTTGLEGATANPKPYLKMSPPELHEGATANPKPYLKMSPPELHEGRDSNEMEETKHINMKREALTCEEGSSTTAVHDASVHIKEEPGTCDTAGGARVIENQNGEESLPRTWGRGADFNEAQNCTKREFLPVRIKEEPLTDEEEPSGHVSFNIKKEPVSDEEDNKSFCIKEELFCDKEGDPRNLDQMQILSMNIKEEPPSAVEESKAEDGPSYHIGGESCSTQARGPSNSKVWFSNQRKDIILARTLPLVIHNPQLTERKMAGSKETKIGLLRKLMELGLPGNKNAQTTRTLTCKPMKMYKCSQCVRYFTSRQRLKRHHLAHKKCKVACPDCGRLFACQATVLRHQVVHSKEQSFPCSFCEKSFSTNKGCEIHQRCHTSDKPFACSECEKAFSLKAQLEAHKMIHTGERYACNECGMCYRTKPGLVLHMRVHRRDLQYYCPECGRGFVHKNTLKNHLLTHSKEKPFACSECSKSFRQKHTLNQHMKVHEAKDQERYSCSECGKSYKRTADYRWHMLIHLGEKG